jgi:hypothetical protein
MLCCVIHAECHWCWVSLMLRVTHAEGHSCWGSLMLTVTHADCHSCWLSLMLTVAHAECHLCWVSHICLHSECRYAGCRYSECRGAIFIPTQWCHHILNCQRFLEQGLEKDFSFCPSRICKYLNILRILEFFLMKFFIAFTTIHLNRRYWVTNLLNFFPILSGKLECLFQANICSRVRIIAYPKAGDVM